MKNVRKISGAALFVALALSGRAALGCAACYGQSDSLMARGMNAGIYALLTVIGCVLCGAGTFFVYLARRASAVAKAEQSRKSSV
jgi:hypothetical protein